MENTQKMPTKLSRMTPEERKMQILKLLDTNGSVSVSELSQHLSLSEVSVRKLLITLEKEGLLQRKWGGAVKITRTMNELTYPMRESKHMEEKIAIAKMAYDLIEDGDSLYLDSGTTTLELAKLIKNGPKRDLLIASNALDHICELLSVPGLNLISIGGEVRQDSRACTGYLTNDTIRQMVFDKGFIGIEHVSIKHGITTPNMRDAELKRSIVSSSKKTIVLADYSKFWNDSLIQIAPSEKISLVITDWHMSAEERNQYLSKGLSISIAKKL